ncbi:uncharacterized protein PHACADRAFT_264873 [Phanerochaete carnosa HHB-10118-sp]|uniref:Uncharacterized protein n=1 Tax=Phanerochaete carnosa (strain HHB-10118-sp) TaxID=650164 RepID=K5WJ38_PHACS|nr:uncharacterized protein PHACADRAFT_264873 [Phanerochaete carnosa HHB-10118-sp]EKM50257.1 hypothetical protein PHACADRAFT_264873 [Phanerochaete carnosa HHB-10118-sp]
MQPPVLINRFMINLRMAGSEVSNYTMHSGDQQHQSTLQFGRTTDRLGNIAGVLQDGWSDELYDEEIDTAAVDDSAEVDEEESYETGA